VRVLIIDNGQGQTTCFSDYNGHITLVWNMFGQMPDWWAVTGRHNLEALAERVKEHGFNSRFIQLPKPTIVSLEPTYGGALSDWYMEFRGVPRNALTMRQISELSRAALLEHGVKVDSCINVHWRRAAYRLEDILKAQHTARLRVTELSDLELLAHSADF
jgi:hypothetical protein